MGVKYEKNGTWTVSYSMRHPVTKKPISRRRKNIKNRVQANKVLKELIILTHNEFQKKECVSWSRLVCEFIDSSKLANLSMKTVLNRETCIKAYTQEWNNKSIEDISSMDIRNVVLEKLKQRSEGHKKNLLKYIKLAFDSAVEAGYLGHNPAPKMHFKIANKLKQVLNQEQVKQLLSKAKELDDEWYPIWAMAIMTGMRNGELYALTWDKVDLEKRIIKVDSSWNSKDGFKDTKSGDDRLVEIAEKLLPLLNKLKKYNDSFFVLPRLTKWDKGEQSRELRKFLISLGLPSIRFHDLRATWATILLNNGIEPIKVMKMGGWKDLKTMQHYIRLAGVEIKGITSVMNFIQDDE